MSIRQIADDNCQINNKKRRSDDEAVDSTSKTRLYAVLQEGNCGDVELLVTADNDEIKGLPAHKKVLVAMSSVIATKMTRRWEEGAQGNDVIEIPLDVCVEAVEKFLQFLYTDEINENLNIELWLQLLFLSDHYEVQNLMTWSDEKLIEKLNAENGIKIYEKSRLFQSAQCGVTAFSFLQKNFGRVLTSLSNEWMEMAASTWKIFLELNYLPNVEEIVLFNGLKRWKNENVEERASDFKELIKLIRFPLIGVKDFAEFIAPSEEIEDKMIQQMFDYFAKKGQVPEQFKNCNRRNLLEPKDSDELQRFVNEGQNGDIIELDGNYSQFEIHEHKSNLTIRGKKEAEAVVIGNWFGIQIKGQCCKIEGISIIFKTIFPTSTGIEVAERSTGNILSNITITGGVYGMHVLGNNNSISNITISDSTFAGFCLGSLSNDNEILNCCVQINDEKIEADGFIINGKGNRLRKLICKNTLGNTRPAERILSAFALDS